MSTEGNSLQAILDLYADYALCLDERNFSSWPDFFAGDCRYEVHSRENWDLGLPSAMVYCDSHGMVQDRVYDAERYDAHNPTGAVGQITHDELWRRLGEFLDEILPVAEETGVKLALHPDDPPIPKEEPPWPW